MSLNIHSFQLCVSIYVNSIAVLNKEDVFFQLFQKILTYIMYYKYGAHYRQRLFK